MNKSSFIIACLVLFILGIGLGFAGGKYSTAITPTQSTSENSVNDKLFDSQSASINGQVLTINGKNLKIRNSTTGASGEIPASDKIQIMKPGSLASASSDLKAIELNKPAFIGLQMVDGKYQASIVQYLPPVLPGALKPATPK